MVHASRPPPSPPTRRLGQERLRSGPACLLARWRRAWCAARTDRGATVARGADPTKARSWWLGEISRLANERDTAIADLAITPNDVAAIVALVEKGELTDKLARQVVEGVIAGEGTPADVVAKRGIKVVNDDGALMAAIEKVCAEQAETAEKVRSGHLPAAGALIGAVMKETKGQADAARVRELLLGHLGQA